MLLLLAQHHNFYFRATFPLAFGRSPARRRSRRSPTPHTRAHSPSTPGDGAAIRAGDPAPFASVGLPGVSVLRETWFLLIPSVGSAGSPCAPT